MMLEDNKKLEEDEDLNNQTEEEEELESEETQAVEVSLEEKARRERVFEGELLPQIDACYTFAYHLVYNEADANDLVQETYLKAYRFIEYFQIGTNSKAWLLRIMKNSFINDYRKKTKRPYNVNIDDVNQKDDIEDDNVSLDMRQEVFGNLIGDEITTAVNDLPVDYRLIILLCDIEGFKYDEIAQIIDVPIGTVRSRLHRARNMLKERLKDYAKQRGFNVE